MPTALRRSSVLAGNVVGGAALFELISYAQVAQAVKQAEP